MQAWLVAVLVGCILVAGAEPEKLQMLHFNFSAIANTIFQQHSTSSSFLPQQPPSWPVSYLGRTPLQIVGPQSPRII